MRTPELWIEEQILLCSRQFNFRDKENQKNESETDCSFHKSSMEVNCQHACKHMLLSVDILGLDFGIFSIFEGKTLMWIVWIREWIAHSRINSIEKSVDCVPFASLLFVINSNKWKNDDVTRIRKQFYRRDSTLSTTTTTPATVPTLTAKTLVFQLLYGENSILGVQHSFLKATLHFTNVICATHLVRRCGHVCEY